MNQSLLGPLSGSGAQNYGAISPEVSPPSHNNLTSSNIRIEQVENRAASERVAMNSNPILEPHGQTQYAVAQVAPSSQQRREDIFLPQPWTSTHIAIAESLYTEKKLTTSDSGLQAHYRKIALLLRKMLQIEDASVAATLDERTDEASLYKHTNWCYRQAIEESVLKKDPDWEQKSQLFEEIAINFSKAAYCLEQIALSLKTEPPLIVDTLPQLHEAVTSSHLHGSLERIKERIEDSSLPKYIYDSFFGEAPMGIMRRNLSNFSFQEPESIKKYRGIIKSTSGITQNPNNVVKLQLQQSLFEQASQYLEKTRDFFSRIPGQNIETISITSLL
ncbi:MAG: hypothetical protein ACOYK6_03850 [Chthoniobacterales bacterium]